MARRRLFGAAAKAHARKSARRSPRRPASRVRTVYRTLTVKAKRRARSAGSGSLLGTIVRAGTVAMGIYGGSGVASRMPANTEFGRAIGEGVAGLVLIVGAPMIASATRRLPLVGKLVTRGVAAGTGLGLVGDAIVRVVKATNLLSRARALLPGAAPALPAGPVALGPGRRARAPLTYRVAAR